MVPGTFFRFYLYSTPPPLSQRAKKSIMKEEREHSCGRETTRNENRGKIVNLGGVKMKNFGGMSLVKKISVTGMGIALFVVLTLCVQVPVFENYYLCLGYIAMAVYLYSIGTVSGTIVGTVGVILYCVLTSGLRGMPGWAAGNVVIGIALGNFFKLIKGKKMNAALWLISVIVIVAATAVGILGVKSLTEHLLYAQPFLVRAAKNIYAFTADAFVLAASLPLCVFLDKRIGAVLGDSDT